ncbi:MAG: ATP-binding cassette domain-containing protein [Myxococcota bacterium]
MVKRFDGRAVLDGIDLDIVTGLTTVIAGASGSGKSLLLKLMNGLVLPDEGEVLLFGENTREVSPDHLLELRKRVTMMFQSYALLDSLDVRENVAFPVSENTSMSSREVLGRAQDLLATLGLGNATRKMPSELSGGMKKRVSLARAVIGNPEVVLFDEPTTGLDPIMIDFVDKMLLETRQRFGITSVIISHDMVLAMNLADRVAMLEDGKISTYGTLAEVLGPKKTPLVDVFFQDAARLDDARVHRSPHEAKKVWTLAPGEEPLAELRAVEKSFGQQKVLKGVDLVVPKRQITVLIGGSGSGKSVMMKLVIGLLRADAGSVVVFGQELGKLTDGELGKLRERYGMVFQGAALLDNFTIAENVAFPLKDRGVKKAEVKERVAEVLEKLHLVDIADRMPSTVSNGQRKRCGLARAIVGRPELIIYDEPTTGQDPVMTRMLDDMIVEAQELFDITSLVVSHDMPSAFRIGNQIAMLHQGTILAAETPASLLQVADPLVRRFIFAGTEEGEEAAEECRALGLDAPEASQNGASEGRSAQPG